MTTAEAQSTVPTGTWKSDPIHSHVGFAVRHVVGTFRGSFGRFEATLSDDSGKPRLSGRVPADSVRVEDESLYGHLLSPEFFDAERNGEITFTSNGISRDEDQLAIEGELSVKGIARPIVARGEIAGPAAGPDAERIGIDLEAKVDRHDFRLDWNMQLPDGGNVLGDEVTLSVHLELVKDE
jgi:polyisoprenoid-binding protein YceI